MKKVVLLASIAAMFSCDTRPMESNSINDPLSLEGTWELVSELKIQGADTTFSDRKASEKMIKIINKTHFSFLKHDLSKGKDSLATFVAGGGTYELEGNTYKEHLEFCIARAWEDNDFEFEVQVKGDTLIQTGIEKIESLGVDRIIKETYVRVGG